ncbi:MAG: carbohydrate ABC transporter substrate-binding protein, partial [Clostridiales bacterium]|nr:carbohydrate ABC transporter substrate-binding protein [Clostridiales bacterium]
MKKSLKVLLSFALILAMAFPLAACGGGSDSGEAEPAAEEGKVLNIWCWNDEFQSRFNDYYPGVKEVAEDKSTTTLEDGTTVKWTINPNEGMNYQDKLDEALLAQESAA